MSSDYINSSNDTSIISDSESNTNIESILYTENSYIESEKIDSKNSSDSEEKYTDYSNYDNIIFNNFFKKKVFDKKYSEEINDLRLIKTSDMYKEIVFNNYKGVIKLLENGRFLFKSSNNNIVKLCSNLKNCAGTCVKECNKSCLYYSLCNFNRGIKTIYHLLIKLLILEKKFRNKCKCCEKQNEKTILQLFEKNFNEIENLDEINLNSNDQNLTELKINYLINKFLSLVSILPCECKFTNKYYKTYKDNYLNFKDTIKIYIKTIPSIIKLLKNIYKIKENNQELYFIKQTRCIHEDIRFNNLTYCIHDNTNIINDNKKINEIICNLDVLNNWINDSIKISVHLYNQQNLEVFRYFLYNCNEDNVNLLSNNFSKIYNKENNLLDLNYSSNKMNIVTSLLEYSNKFSTLCLNNLINTIIRQYEYRKDYNFDNYNLNEIFLNLIIECFNYNSINLGLEFLKNIKNLKDSLIDNSFNKKIENIINIVLETNKISTNTKISYLKIINKNDINIINYDIINKLIEIDIGDYLIEKFKSDEKSLINKRDSDNTDYITNTIKKCLLKNKVNILDYIFHHLNNNIKSNKIDTILLYFYNVNKNNNKKDYESMKLLKIILKYLNTSISIEKLNNKRIQKDSTNVYPILFYCIKYKLTHSAKLFIDYGLDLEIKYEDKNLLFYCIDNNNHIVAEYIINKNNKIIKSFHNKYNVINYLFNTFEKNNINDNNIFIRFLVKIINGILKNDSVDDIINFQDNKNELLGFKILQSSLNKKNKILLFNIIKDHIDPLLINNFIKNGLNRYNFPIIMLSVLMDEYEITYIFLNNLLKNNKIVKENRKINNDNMSEELLMSDNMSNSTIFDYTLKTNNINVNIIPVVFKFIKDNYNNIKIYENTNLNKCYLENELLVIKKLFELLMFTVYFICFSIGIYQKNILKHKKIILETSDTSNRYVEISSDNNEKSINKYILTKNLQDNSSLDTLTTSMNNSDNVNKNIWLRNKNSNSEKIIDKILLDDKLISIESNEIEESDICFDN